MQIKIRHIIVWIMPVISFPSLIQAQSDWKFRKEENEVKSWTRKVDGSKFEEYKVETTADGTIESCVAILQDESAYPLLFEDLKEYKILDKKSDSLISYLHTNLPFPVKDRDGYYKFNFEYYSSGDLVKVSVLCIDNYEKKKGVVRVEYCTGSWEFRKINEQQVLIAHTFHADPKGAIPAWLVNKKTVDSPILTLMAMKKLTSLEKYQTHSID